VHREQWNERERDTHDGRERGTQPEREQLGHGLFGSGGRAPRMLNCVHRDDQV
jgi:hypothetical protein